MTVTAIRPVTARPRLAPYTAVEDFITTFFTAVDFWHAAKSWSDPMTLISFIALRPPTRVGVEMIERWTSVSTSVVSKS